MDISILRSGQALPLSREPVDLAVVAASTAEEYRRLSAEYEITTRLEEGVVGDWDAIRIERVLRNLLDNALKYSPDGGRVEVVVRSDDGWAVAEVTDHGVGIPEDELPLLFEKFHRGSNTRDLRGTGLGLAGSRAVVQQLGGTIDVRSRLGGRVDVRRAPAPRHRPGRVATHRRTADEPAPRDRLVVAFGEARSLLDLDGRAGLGQLLLGRLGLLLGDALLHRLGGGVDEVLRLLEAKAGQLADRLDHEDLVRADLGEHRVELGLLLGRGGSWRHRHRAGAPAATATGAAAVTP